jgi:hypothetical protein
MQSIKAVHAHRTTVTLTIVVLAALALCAAGGCGTVVAPLKEVPPLLAAVLEDGENSCDTEPADTNGMQPIASADSVDGCWTGCLRLWENDSGDAVLTAEALSFDATTSRLERFIYGDLPPLVRYVDVHRGNLELNDDGSATFAVTRVLSTARTGRLTEVTYENLPVYDVEWGMLGEDLLIYMSEHETPRTAGGFADRVNFKLARVNCP